MCVNGYGLARVVALYRVHFLELLEGCCREFATFAAKNVL